MEILRILGGLGVIAVIVVLVGLSKGDSSSGESARAERPAERSFSSNTSRARFVAPPGG